MIETVRVKHSALDYVVINKSDFDPEQHELYSEPEKEDANEEIEEEVPPVSALAAKEPELPSAIAQKTGQPVIPDFTTSAAPRLTKAERKAMARAEHAPKAE
jgi:hypothetical protein